MNVITQEELAHVAQTAVPAHEMLHGKTKCKRCGLTVVAHAHNKHFAYLYVLCDGTLAKIIKYRGEKQ